MAVAMRHVAGKSTITRRRSFLLERPERVIAVVAHGTFFFHLTGRHLANCEVATIELK